MARSDVVVPNDLEKIIVEKQISLKETKTDLLKKTTNNSRIAIMGITQVEEKEGMGDGLSPRVAAEQACNEDEKKSKNENAVMESDLEFDSQASSELENPSLDSKERLKVAR